MQSRLIFGCSYSGTHKTIKNANPDLYRNKVSKRTNCPFKIIVRSPQNIASAWHITSINPVHNNHIFQSGIQEFNRIDKQLSDKMHAMIASFDGRFNLEQVIYLLNNDWPDKIFDRRIVANTIQKAAKIKASRYNGSETAELFKILQNKTYENKNWFIATELDSKGRFQRIFWMSLSQRSLYRRYCDIVLNDNTFKTNRFHILLNIVVIVDNNGKSRLVGYALVSGETSEDYEWILQQLLTANNYLAPKVIMVDENAAMEAACANVLKNTVLLNCIWHLGH